MYWKISKQLEIWQKKKEILYKLCRLEGRKTLYNKGTVIYEIGSIYTQLNKRK